MDQGQLIDIGLYGSYILTGIAIVAVIVMYFVNAANDPKVLIKGAIGVAALGIIFLIGYSMAPEVLDSAAKRAFEGADWDINDESTLSTFKYVGGAMTTTLVLLVVALVGLIYSSVARLIG